MSAGWRDWLRLVLVVAGSAGWVRFLARLLGRSLHMLQLESYLTGRLLRWWLRRPTRLLPLRWLGPTAAGAVLGVTAASLTSSRATLGTLGWAAAGLWLARFARFPTAKKPLVLTARARRLVAGQGLVTALLVAGLAWPLARREPVGLRLVRLGRAVPTGLALAGPLAPLLTAVANLLLFPLESLIRRYYLRDAARKLRRLGPMVVAVAGSYGKSSTKEFVAAILSSRFEVLRPPGSFNTPMGLTRVIREQLQPSHEVFVAELGDWVPGDIAFLCRLLGPRVGVLTAIGPEHLERFKTIERVEASKLELLEALPTNGTAVLNFDDPAVRRLAAQTPRASVISFGVEAPDARVRARDIRTTRDGLEFVVEADGYGQTKLRVGLLGRHNVANVLAGVAVGLALGLRLDEIARAARRIEPVEHRLQPIRGEGGVLVIDDAFNSNPRGAAAALDVLGELEGGRRILVTPGMVELAEQEFEANRAFARQAAGVCDEVILVGRGRAAPLLAGLRDRGFPERRVHVVADLQAATERLASLVRSGDVVLFENDLPDTYADN